MTGPADRFRPHGRGPAYSLANKLDGPPGEPPGCCWRALLRQPGYP